MASRMNCAGMTEARPSDRPSTTACVITSPAMKPISRTLWDPP